MERTSSDGGRGIARPCAAASIFRRTASKIRLRGSRWMRARVTTTARIPSAHSMPKIMQPSASRPFAPRGEATPMGAVWAGRACSAVPTPWCAEVDRSTDAWDAIAWPEGAAFIACIATRPRRIAATATVASTIRCKGALFGDRKRTLVVRIDPPHARALNSTVIDHEEAPSSSRVLMATLASIPPKGISSPP